MQLISDVPPAATYYHNNGFDTELNAYKGGVFQQVSVSRAGISYYDLPSRSQAASALSTIPNTAFESVNGFETFGFECQSKSFSYYCYVLTDD